MNAWCVNITIFTQDKLTLTQQSLVHLLRTNSNSTNTYDYMRGGFILELMTYKDFEKLLNSPAGSYYEGRWAYFKEVIDIVKKQDNVNSVLELGPSFLPVVKDCDIMIKPRSDAWGRPSSKAPKEYMHDATVVPWPIKEKEYDIFIALQVWEHLVGKQREAFKEVMRVSKMAILSFPYMWDCPKDNANYPEHHMINESIILDWTLGVEPQKIINVQRTGEKVSKGPRIIYFWRF